MLIAPPVAISSASLFPLFFFFFSSQYIPRIYFYTAASPPHVPKKDIAAARMLRGETAAFIQSDANNIRGATKPRRYNAPRNTAVSSRARLPLLSLRRKHVGKHGEIAVNIWLAFAKRSASPSVRMRYGAFSRGAIERFRAGGIPEALPSRLLNIYFINSHRHINIFRKLHSARAS